MAQRVHNLVAQPGCIPLGPKEREVEGQMQFVAIAVVRGHRCFVEQVHLANAGSFARVTVEYSTNTT